MNPAEELFEELSDWNSIDRLVSEGEPEGLYLEAKAPGEPHLSRDQRQKLSQSTSGFANTGGGVIIWGVSTTHHQSSNLDVLSQLEPIGNCRAFQREIDGVILRATTPSISPVSKVITQNPSDRRGIVLTYIPPSNGDPIQTNGNSRFYFRDGDQFLQMPYEMIKRMFAGSESPDLKPQFDERIVSLGEDGTWDIPIILSNSSSAASDKVAVQLTISNPEACEEVTALSGFDDSSEVNPGERIFHAKPAEPIFRGLNVVVGRIKVKMSRGRRARRVLLLTITVYASHMRARRWTMRINLTQSGFSVTSTSDSYVY